MPLPPICCWSFCSSAPFILSLLKVQPDLVLDTHTYRHTQGPSSFSPISLLFPFFSLGLQKALVCREEGRERSAGRETEMERWRWRVVWWWGIWRGDEALSICPSHSPQPSLTGALPTHCQTCASLRVCPVGPRALPSAHLSIRLCVCLCCPVSPLLRCH